jgi:hypothetical protein
MTYRIAALFATDTTNTAAAMMRKAGIRMTPAPCLSARRLTRSRETNTATAWMVKK